MWRVNPGSGHTKICPTQHKPKTANRPVKDHDKDWRLQGSIRNLARQHWMVVCRMTLELRKSKGMRKGLSYGS